MKGRALREGVWWAVAAVAVAVGMSLFWRDGADSFRTTWETVAAGAETVPWSAGAVVWDEKRGVVAPRSPLPLLVAAATSGSAGYLAWVFALGLAWTGGTRRLALDLGAGAGVAAAAGTAAGWLVFCVTGGPHAPLEAAALPWLLAAVIRGGGPVATATPAVALGLVSPEGIRLALPVLVADALCRGSGGGRWLPPALGAVTLFVVPEPEWARFFRFEAPRAFTEGAYGWSGRSTWEVLRTVVGGTSAWAAALGGVGLAAAALVGTVGGGRRGAIGALFAIGLAGLALGEVSGATLASPATVLSLVFPAIRMHPVPDVAAVALGPLLLALAARVPGSGLAAVACLVPALLSGVPGAASPLPEPGRIAHEIPARRGGVLALPVTLENDRRWRRALPDAPALRNGTQGILAANAPVLARELGEANADRVREILQRLGVAYAIAPSSRAGEIGVVVMRDGEEALVRRTAGASGGDSSPCLSAATWTFRSSVGHPEVSIPARAVDGDPATRWGTGAPQREGQFFEIDFGRVLDLERVELRHERFETDFPRGFRVLAAARDGRWREVFSRDPYLGEPRWHETFLYEVPDGTVRLPLGGRPVRRLRIELTRPSLTHDWSIASICAVAQASGSGSAR